MINKQARDKMAEMLALIKKYGKLGDVPVDDPRTGVRSGIPMEVSYWSN
jgi:hypothetical protein